MAYAIGTADDFVDAARKLRDFASGSLDPTTHPDFSAGSGMVPGPQQWTVETNGGGQPTLPGSGSATDGEVYLTGPGGGADEIYVRFRTYRDVGSGVFNWEIRGATDFLDSELFEDQTNSSPPAYFALANSTMNVWFFVNGRRIIAVLQSGTTFECCYMGFLNEFSTAVQWPYPLFVGGSANIQLRSISDNNYGHSCVPDPAEDAAHIRWVDGTWYDVSNYFGSGTSRPHQTTRNIWPYSLPDLTAPDHGQGPHTPSTVFSAESVWRNFGGISRRIISSFTGSFPLLPCMLAMDDVAPQAGVFGELDGIRAVYGEAGLNAGDTITEGSDTYIVFSNTWRSELADFFVVKQE